jgi:hypothetical protein
VGIWTERNKAIREMSRIVEYSGPPLITIPSVVGGMWGKHSMPLVEAFEDKALPALRKGDGGDLRVTLAFLKDFCRYLLSPEPSLEEIGRLVSEVSSVKAKPEQHWAFILVEKMSAFAAPRQHDIIAVVIITILTIALSAALKFVVGFSLEVVAMMAIGIEGCLIAIWSFLRQPPR